MWPKIDRQSGLFEEDTLAGCQKLIKYPRTVYSKSKAREAVFARLYGFFYFSMKVFPECGCYTYMGVHGITRMRDRLLDEQHFS